MWLLVDSMKTVYTINFYNRSTYLCLPINSLSSSCLQNSHISLNSKNVHFSIAKFLLETVKPSGIQSAYVAKECPQFKPTSAYGTSIIRRIGWLS